LKKQPAPKNLLGPALKELRLSLGWTLGDASARLRQAGMSCTAQKLDRIERQQRCLHDFEILYFCELLGVTQDELGERLKQAMVRRPRRRRK
jgi:hypothetical protein